MAEMVNCIATIFDSSVGTVVRQFGYLWNHKKNIKNLKSEVKKLDSVREDISRAVTVAERNAQIVRTEVNNWQSNAQEFGVSATEIIGKYEDDAKKRCPNLVSLYWGSRKAIKKQIEIVQVRTEAAQFSGVADRPVRQVPAAPSTKGYLTFDSRNSILEEIVKAMKKDTVNSIGVYGLGGMGKTTLAKQVASRVAEEKMFDDVVMAPVNQTPNLKEIQGEIAKSLDLQLEGSSVAERAGNIYKRMKEKKILVILDDLWAKLNLEEVGITFGPEHKGCKLLFTSRSRDVLFSMGTNKDFNVEALGEYEAWSLFAEKTVNVIKDPALLSVGKEVAKECAGLPVLIVTVAASLSSRPSLHAWKDALKELKRMNNKEVQEIVNSALEFIPYNHLPKTHKRLFLLCGLRGSGFLISDLLKYSWGWKFFDEDVATLEEARNKMHALILDLKASCLLLDGDDEDIIEIHDVVRGVAISLARKDQNMLLVGDGDTELIRWPNDDVLRSCIAIFFEDCQDFSCLPEQLECPLLECFYLNGISLDASSTIPGTFFQKIRELKVLDMTELCFSGLPSSLSCLKNLQTLCLDYCTNLEDISMIKELKKLQVLSFIGSDIEELPRGIGQLPGLRLLDLTSCSELEIIPAGLLAGLSNLEELYMRESFNKWEAEEFHSCNSERSSNASLAELKQLPKLHSLEIDVEDAKLLSQDLNFERLERYRIISGDMLATSEIDKKGFSRRLGVNHLKNGVKGLKRAECLCLEEVNGIKNIINELDRDGFTELKHLNIQTDYDIQFIVNVELQQQMAFPALESLYLYNILKLENICNGRLMKNSFGKLTTVEVRDCNKLESLFSFSMAIGLPCLQELQVVDCSILKGIVAKKSDEDYSEKMEFVQLRRLWLEGLPQLTSFYYNVKEKQSEEIVSEEEEPTSSMSLFKEVNFPSLESLRIYDLDNIKSIWHNQANEEDSCCKLEVVQVEGCAKLLKIFPYTMLNKIQSVKEVRIVDCEALEEVFEVQEALNLKKIRNDITTVTYQLRYLSLKNLPKLRFVWKKDFRKIISFENLCHVKVRECESLKSVFPACVAQCLHQLKELSIKECMEVETIVEEDNDGDDENEEVSVSPPTFTFPKLTKLYLWKLPKVECFYPKKHASEWPLLEQLDVTDCDQIFILDFPYFSGKQEDNQFQKLSSLTLTIRSKDMKIMRKQYGDFTSELFLNFRSLTLTGFDGDESAAAAFPSSFLYALHNLKSLIIQNSSFGEIFPYEEGQEEIFPFPSLLPLLPHFKELSLINMSEMKYICTQNSPFFPILNQLHHLYLLKCPRLTNLVPPGSVSFKFLTSFTVRDCGGLKYLISSSTAASLEQLTYLEISRCPMMEEIVAADDSYQDDRHIILFINLEDLILEDLPRLTNFSTANNYTFKFPSFCKITVGQCPNMKTFSPEITIISPEITVRPPLLSLYHEALMFTGKMWLHTPKQSMSLRTAKQIISEIKFRRRITRDPSTSSNNHVEPEAHIHEKPIEYTGKEAEEIFEEVTEPRKDGQICEDGVGELGKKPEISENVIKPENEIEVCEDVIEPREGVGIVEKCNEPRNGTNICEEVVEEGKVADSCEKGKGKVETESRNSEDHLNGDLNTTVQHLYSEMETPRLTAADPTTSEPEAQTQIHDNPTESAANEIQEISEESTKQREEGQTTEPAKTENNIDPIEEIGVLEQPNDPILGQKVDICGGATKPGKGKGKIGIREEAVVDPAAAGNEGETWNRPSLESNISEKSHPCYQTQANSSFRSAMSCYQHGESSVPTEQQSDKSKETVPSHSNPSSFSPANVPQEQTNTQLLAPQDVVASSSSPTSNHPETSPSLVTEEADTSRGASNSQQNDFQTFCARKGFITLLSEFLQIYQTQPLDSMSIDQGQLMVDAFRDLSNVNFSIEWFSPYVEKVKARLEQKKEISELELKIAETEAQLQALKEKKRALEEKIISPQQLEDS